MRNLIALVSGGLFGIGLLISGMTDTNRVQGWLDVFGAWDPALAFVQGGAILPMAIAWRVAQIRQAPVLGRELSVATGTEDLEQAGGRIAAVRRGLGFGRVVSGTVPGIPVLRWMGRIAVRRRDGGGNAAGGAGGPTEGGSGVAARPLQQIGNATGRLRPGADRTNRYPGTEYPATGSTTLSKGSPRR